MGLLIESGMSLGPDRGGRVLTAQPGRLVAACDLSAASELFQLCSVEKLAHIARERRLSRLAVGCNDSVVMVDVLWLWKLDLLLA